MKAMPEGITQQDLMAYTCIYCVATI